MKKQKIECTCDRCGKSITEREHDDTRILVYTKRIMYGVAYKEMYLCNDCLKEYFKFSKSFLKNKEE